MTRGDETPALPIERQPRDQIDQGWWDSNPQQRSQWTCISISIHRVRPGFSPRIHPPVFWDSSAARPVRIAFIGRGSLNKKWRQGFGETLSDALSIELPLAGAGFEPATIGIYVVPPAFAMYFLGRRDNRGRELPAFTGRGSNPHGLKGLARCTPVGIRNDHSISTRQRHVFEHQPVRASDQG